MTVVATLKDGRTISREAITPVDREGAGKVYVEATFPQLRRVEYLIQTNFSATPNTDFSPEEPVIDVNVVGITVYCGAGTTISGEMIVTGY